jgi:acyl-ACP thioesterase
MTLNSAQWEKLYKVKSYEVDVNARLTTFAVCNYFQEVAWEHAQSMNFGFEFLRSINKFWVLSRLQIKCYTYPRWTDEIKVITWPKGIDGMFALRDYLVLSASGEKHMAATTAWLILDSEKHRPQRINSSEHPLYTCDQTDAYIHAPAKLISLNHHDHTMYLEVKYSDLDVNKHVNNVKYIQWAFDALSNELMRGALIDEMVVNPTFATVQRISIQS